MAGNLVVRQVPKPAAKIAVKTKSWRKKICRPWSNCCDTRAVVAIVILLHLEKSQNYFVSIAEIVNWIKKGDFSALTYMRRQDVREAFSDRHDVIDTVTLAVEMLVSEYVLLALGQKSGPELYRIEPSEIDTLNNVHVQMHDMNQGRGKFRLV